ncbi:hypothetical protein HpHA116_11580 [Helicobacter pylori]
MVVGSEEMENNGCFMPIISSEKDSEIFFSKLSGTEFLMEYLNNKGYTPSNLKGYTLSNKIFYYKSKAPKTKKIFIVKNSLLDSGLLNINPNLREDFISDNTKLILKAFESKHINVKHKHREKELEILFFENKQELYNSINKP